MQGNGKNAKGEPIFNENRAEDVRGLQRRLNQLNMLMAKDAKGRPMEGEAPEALEISGAMDAPTKAAWLKFKQFALADGTLSRAYLQDRFGIGDAKLSELGIDDKGARSDGYNPEHPPKAVIREVQRILGLEQTGKLDVDTRLAIKEDQKAHWIDETVDGETLRRLDAAIKSRSAARTTPAPGIEPAAEGAVAPLPAVETRPRSR